MCNLNLILFKPLMTGKANQFDVILINQILNRIKYLKVKSTLKTKNRLLLTSLGHMHANNVCNKINSYLLKETIVNWDIYKFE